MIALAPKPSKVLLAIFAILLVTAIWLRFFVVEKPINKTQIGSQSYQLELATTTAERIQGLSDRQWLGADNGMLFVFPANDRHCFWMKDTNFALDIIWLNAQNQVTHIYENVSPASYPESFCSGKDGRYGIELPAGSVQKSGLQIGNFIDL